MSCASGSPARRADRATIGPRLVRMGTGGSVVDLVVCHVGVTQFADAALAKVREQEAVLPDHVAQPSAASENLCLTGT
jgi:hypothetical protein